MVYITTNNEATNLTNNPTSIPAKDGKISRKNSKNDLLMVMCRICHSEESDIQSLISPCLCDGSLNYVHNDCLQRWLKMTGKFRFKL